MNDDRENIDGQCNECGRSLEHTEVTDPHGITFCTRRCQVANWDKKVVGS